MAATSLLTDRERETLAAVCDAFHPSLAAEAGDDPALFSASASSVGVPDAAEDAIALLASTDRAQIRQLLWLLDTSVFARLAGGAARSIRRMSPDERERLLIALSTSTLPQLRSGFQAFKRLSSFLFYANADAYGDNPLWPHIGYTPSRQPEPGSSRLDITTFASETRLDADVCVIGSGAGGGVAAAMLASRGLRVIVLEAGPPDQAGDFTQRELDGTQRLYLDSGLASTRDASIPILAGACVGGGTTVNWQTSLPLPDDVRDEWTERSGANVFTSERFTRALDAVTRRLKVSTAESAVNENNARIRRGCEALGYAWSVAARNSSGCDAAECGYCVFGCRIQGKQSTPVTYLRDAQVHGDTTIVANCRVDRVTVAGGRAIGVIAASRQLDGSNVRVTVRAPHVVVAAGGIHSAAILLRSGLTLPAIGRHLYLHPTTAALGFYDDRVAPWSGPPQTIMSDHFARIDGNYGFLLEAAPVHPGLLALAIPWASARDHRRLVQKSSRGAAIIAVTRDAEGGRVRARRNGSVAVDYRPTTRQNELLARGMSESARVHFAAGASHLLSLHTRPISLRRTSSTTQRDIDEFCSRILAERVGPNRWGVFSAHQMGTCRIGRHARSAVCDETGEVFGVRGLYVADASAFPASSGVNPMITIMALAMCIAERVAS
jgi:choline dehydrogenase-like flavoprotein